jgi:hypothetical protein
VKRVVLPAFLARMEPTTHDEDTPNLFGGRLPSGAEWKKLWRGGLFLDGDASARAPNPEPDRLVPTPMDPVTRSPLTLEPTVYGALFDTCELVQGSRGGVFDQPDGRYFVSLATPEQRRRRRIVRRFVLDVPRALT